MSRTGARILVDQLVLQGADTIFCVPGESYLAALDALYDTPSIRLVTCRQEGGATMMADADAKLTGKPGIVMVSRGPGAMNGSAGLHIARQDSTPLIMFIGQVARGTLEREALQGIDYRQMFGPVAKWVAQIDDPATIPEFVSRAFHIAVNGRPGPVVLALPEDMLTDEADVADAAPYQVAATYPSPDAMAEFYKAFDAAERPFFIVGGSTWDQRCDGRLEASPPPTSCRSAARSAVRRCSTICTNATPAMSASASIPTWRSASATPI